MTGGFGLVAWPVRYRDTGIVSFIVSRDGRVYQQDLGDKSATVARAMTRFDPDPTWTAIEP